MRRPRLLKHGASYHVSARANGRAFIFASKGARSLFLSVVRRAKKRYRFSIENFAIMGNHFHFIIRPKDKENLSRIMQWILSVFAVSFNKSIHSSGHVWGERFFSRILESLSQYFETFKYISFNPAKAGIVRDPIEWEHGGLYEFMAKKYGILDKSKLILNMFMKLLGNFQ